MTLLLAHRGSHRDHIENTMPAFEAALAEGADGVELDVRVCRSGEVVVVHDPTLERVAGRPLEIARVPWSLLRNVEVGPGRLSCLDDVLDRVIGAGKLVNVEVKGDVPDPRRTARLVGALLMRRTASERESVLLSAFHPNVLGALATSAPNVRRGFLFDLEHTGRWRAEMIRRLLRPHGLHPHFSLCTPSAVSRWRGEGRYVAPWTLNDPEEAVTVCQRGVDFIITDDVPRLREVLPL
ncbi:MAG: glycerophosphodiester phosphodiesterase [Sandaracinaceae bacterium]